MQPTTIALIMGGLAIVLFAIVIISSLRGRGGVQQRLEQSPQAAEWDVASARLEIARGLATNTRAVIEVGDTSDIARALTMRDILQEDSSRTAEAAASANGAARPEAAPTP